MGLEDFIVRDANSRTGMPTSDAVPADMHRESIARRFDTLETQTPMRNPHQPHLVHDTPIDNAPSTSNPSVQSTPTSMDVRRSMNLGGLMGRPKGLPIRGG